MNIIIAGCGRTGSRLSSRLDELGHDVAVVAADKKSFELLSEDFSGLCVCGSVSDVDVLKKAGCDNADIGIAVTDSDNLNIMVARTMSVEFGIKDVYVRLLDPSREAVFRRLGLRTVCATKLETEVLLSFVEKKNRSSSRLVLGESGMSIVREQADRRSIGKQISCIPCRKNEMVLGLIRADGSVCLANEPSLTVEQSDTIIYALKDQTKGI